MNMTTDFHFFPGLKGSARGVSIVRFLMGCVIYTRLRSIFSPQILMSDLSIGCIGLAYYLATFSMLLGIWSQVSTAVTGTLLMIFFFGHEFGFESLIGRPILSFGSFGEPTHIYFMAIITLLLSLTECGGFYSIDSLVNSRSRQRQCDLRAVQLIRIQIYALYFWTVIGKLNALFIKGYVVEQAWIVGLTGSLGFFHEPRFMFAFAVAGIIVLTSEFSLLILLMNPKWRMAGLLLGTVFHLASTLLVPVWGFATAILCTYILFFEPDQIDRFIARNS
jgi:hypothetical protein